MFDKEAIEKIQESTASKGVQDALINAETLTPTIAIPKGVDVDSLERFMPNRARFRGTMKTKSVDDYIQYVNENCIPSSTQCFIDKEDMTAKTIFNLGSASGVAGHADYVAHLGLICTAEFEAVLKAIKNQLSQHAIAEFVEDWSDNIKSYYLDDGQLALIRPVDAINALRKVKLSETKDAESHVGNLSGVRSALEKIEISSSSGKMPEYFIFNCVPYDGLPAVDVRMRLTVLRNKQDNEMIGGFMLRPIQLEKLYEEIGQSFKQKLSSAITDVPIYIGDFKC